LAVTKVKVDDIGSRIKKAYELDKSCVRLLNDPVGRDKLSVKLDNSEGLLYKADKIYVPIHEATKSFILDELHDSPLSGHVGIAKTIELVKRRFY